MPVSYVLVRSECRMSRLYREKGEILFLVFHRRWVSHIVYILASSLTSLSGTVFWCDILTTCLRPHLDCADLPLPKPANTSEVVLYLTDTWTLNL